MKRGYLSEYFTATAFKRLSAVEADRQRSNQHEFNGVNGLKVMLGSERRSFPATFIYLRDEDPEPISSFGNVTWYDSREAHPTRSEYRLYFPDNDVSDRAKEGDLLLIAKRPDDTLLVMIAEAGSTLENQLLWLFGVADLTHPGFGIRDERASDGIPVNFAARYILEQIGVVVERVEDNYLDRMLREFNGGFPSTRAFSAFARLTVDADPSDASPDQLVMAWMEREEILFRTLERHLIGGKLKEGFGDDVDAFIQFSLSVQNRRKSRAGSALENHLEYLFSSCGIRYSRAPRTEGRSRPDFLFPGEAEYRDRAFLQHLLTMLGVKSTCKDRWRQILAEADRIDLKHLLTMEPGISENQTDEMQARGVQLVIPSRLHETYSARQRHWLMDLSGFIALVSDRQRRIDHG